MISYIRIFNSFKKGLKTGIQNDRRELSGTINKFL